MSTQIHASIDEATVRQISEELNLEDLDYDSLVDPLDAAEEKDQVGPDEADILSFSEAVDEHGALLEEYFGSIVDPESNYLTALSTALFTTGTVIHVPEGVDAEDVTIRTTMNSRSLFNYTLVVAEESSSVTILERQETGDGGASESPSSDGEAAGTVEGNRYYSGITEIAAHENSYVQFGNLQDLDETTYVYSLREADIDTYATANWIECNVGSHLSKATVESHLNGDASESKIVGAFYGHDDQLFDIDARVWHNAEHTTADLVTRGVVDDVARSVYEGVQHVGADAWDTSSYQRENTLMLSDESEADASPKLIINNHDTEASHSATVGQVSAEDMFYMTSRGLGERIARNMLVEGFYVPVFEEIEVEELRDDLRSRILDRLQSRE